MEDRTYFAGQALIGLISNDNLVRVITEAGAPAGQSFDERLAYNAFDIADAMIIELSRRKVK